MADFSSSFAWPPDPMTRDGDWPQGYWPPPGSNFYWPPPGSNFYWPGFANSGDSSSSSGMGAGTIILVAVLVTGFSLMALLVLRLWFCGCGQDDDARPGRRLAGRIHNAGPPDLNVHKCATFGLKREVIESFQVVNYAALTSGRSHEDERLSCPVCLIDFEEEDQRIRVLPGCEHSFHSECVDMWLFSHTSCPLCRRDLQPKPPIDHQQQVVIEIGPQAERG